MTHEYRPTLGPQVPVTLQLDDLGQPYGDFGKMWPNIKAMLCNFG